MGSEQGDGQSQEARRGLPRSGDVLDDPLSTTFPDEEHSSSERRFVTVGRSARGRVLVVVHTDVGEATRIISAREATRAEQKFYEEN